MTKARTLADFDTTSIPASVLTGNLPALNGSALTSLTSANLTGALPALDGSSLTGIGVTPSFSAHAGNTGQNVNNNTNTKVTFDTELFDSDGKFSDSRFTPTVAGKYLIAAAVSFSNLAANAYTQLRVKKNDTDIFQETTQNVASTADTKTQSVFVLDLDDDDYVEIFARQNSGSAQTLRTGMEVRFSGFKIA